MELKNPSHGETPRSPPQQYPLFPDDTVDDSSFSTPFVSAPSSPGRDDGASPDAGGYFFSCPASPVHYVLSSPPYTFSSAAAAAPIAVDEASASGSFEFDGAVPRGTMISADELFLNGQIRPLKLSSHLPLAPLLDFGDDDDEGEAKEMTPRESGEEGGRGRDLRVLSRSINRRTRSMSPLRNPRFQWQGDEDEKQDDAKELAVDPDPKEAATPPESASSSSGSRNSKRWIFLKDLLLYRSKSEGSGRGNGKEKEKFWHSISFSPSSKSKAPLSPSPASPPPAAVAADSSPAPEQNTTKRSKRPANGVGRRRGAAVPSAHERLYTANRAQAEEMRRRTFLPYRQGLLGCLGFTSRSYSAFDGLVQALNPVSSR